MKMIDGRIRLSDLASRLGVTNQSLRNHMKNESGLGVDAVKFAGGLTSDWLLSFDSTLNFLGWLFGHSKKLDFNTIKEVKDEISCLKNQ